MRRGVTIGEIKSVITIERVYEMIISWNICEYLWMQLLAISILNKNGILISLKLSVIWITANKYTFFQNISNIFSHSDINV